MNETVDADQLKLILDRLDTQEQVLESLMQRVNTLEQWVISKR